MICSETREMVMAAQAVRMKAMGYVYCNRHQWTPKAELEEFVGADIEFEMAHLCCLGYMEKNDNTYAITSPGIEFFEAWVLRHDLS
jgi:hypothetical protein